MGDQYRLAELRGDHRGGVADMDHERAAADPGAVDPFRGQAEIMRDRHRRLAGGRDAVDVGWLEPGIGHRVERRIGVQLDLRHVGDDAEPGRLGGADNGDRFRLHRLPPRRAEEGEGDLVVELLKATSTGMSSSNASGVCGQPVMLVIRRGPRRYCPRPLPGLPFNSLVEPLMDAGRFDGKGTHSRVRRYHPS
jgi:hypothetical protein